MAYREGFRPHFDMKLLEMFAPRSVMQRVKDAISDGKVIEIEHSSFNDPDDYSKILIDNQAIHTIQGY